jgi:hypothetical protein
MGPAERDDVVLLPDGENAAMAVDDEVIQRMEVRDAQLMALSDVLDVKASIVLVIITFLATQNADFLLSPSFPAGMRPLPIFSGGALIVAAVLAILAVWPRDHEAEGAEGYPAWIAKLRLRYEGDVNLEQKVESAFRDGRLKRLAERIATNAAVVDSKSWLLDRAFIATSVAVTFTVGTVVALALP